MGFIEMRKSSKGPWEISRLLKISGLETDPRVKTESKPESGPELDSGVLV